MTLSGHGRIPDEQFTVFSDFPLIAGSKVGDTVTVTLWRGQVDSVANRLGTAQIGANPVGDLRMLDYIAALLLLLALGAQRWARARLARPRWPRVERVIRNAWPPGLAAGIALVTTGDFEIGLVITALVALPAFALYVSHTWAPGSNMNRVQIL